MNVEFIQIELNASCQGFLTALGNWGRGRIEDGSNKNIEIFLYF